MNFRKILKNAVITSLMASCITYAAPFAANAKELVKGFNPKDWVSNGTLPWNSHTDHGSEYYQSWNAEFGKGYLTLHSIHNSGGHKYESGVVYGKVSVPATGYKYITIDIDIYNPNAGVRGCWPAFWLDSTITWPPEIDIAEFKGDQGKNVWQNVDDSNGKWQVVQTDIDKTKWHHYKLELGPANNGGNRTYQLFLDGKLKMKGEFLDTKNAPFWVIANYAMEGESGSPGPTNNTYVQYHNYVLATH